jgi:hypothetical protein
MNKKPIGGNISFQDLYESMDHVVTEGSRESFFKNVAKLMGKSITPESLMARPKDPQTRHIDKMWKDGKTAKDALNSLPEAKKGGMSEGKVAGMKDDALKKLHGQMKDEQLSGAAASQFKDIVRELKKRGCSLSEAAKVPPVYDFTAKKKPPQAVSNMVRKLRKSGMSDEQISKKLKMTLNTVQGINEGKKMSKKDLMSIISKLSGTKISDKFVKGGGKGDDEKIDVTALIGKLKENFDEDLGALIEGATENALKSLQAILGMFKGKHDNDIYKMGSGIMDYYKKEKSFSPDQAKWIWKTSVALFKN